MEYFKLWNYLICLKNTFNRSITSHSSSTKEPKEVVELLLTRLNSELQNLRTTVWIAYEKETEII